ncbi:MAG: hypothetical protein AVDCRST_MAG35-517, partial [uncultured Quadrisphaera sp.]
CGPRRARRRGWRCRCSRARWWAWRGGCWRRRHWCVRSRGPAAPTASRWSWPPARRSSRRPRT